MVALNRQLKTGRSPNAKTRWLGPLPIWARSSHAGLRLADNARTAQPAILRFDHDDFMQEFIDTLNTAPQRLGEWLAQPETWRAPMPSPKLSGADTPFTSKVAFLYDQTQRNTQAKRALLPTAINLQPLKSQFFKKAIPAVELLGSEQLPLKLYQSSQKRHYLVTASLISEEPGMPDCEPELKRQEKASFVIRRLLPPEDNDDATLDQWDEYAFVPGPRGNSWRRIGRHKSTATNTLVPDEELLPMFPVTFDSHCGDSRRLLNGVIPVSRREQWVGANLGADVSTDISASEVNDAGRSMASFLFQADVVAPWKLLLEQAEFKNIAASKTFTNFGNDDTAEGNDRKLLMRTSRDEIQTGSWYVLLDFARFIQTYLPDLWQALTGVSNGVSLNDGEQALLSVLKNTRLSAQLAWRIISGKNELVDLSAEEEQLLEVLQYDELLSAAGTVGGISDLTQTQLNGGLRVPSDNAHYKYTHLKWSLADALVAAPAAGVGLEAVDTTFTRFGDSGIPLAIDTNWPDFLFPLADPDFAAPIPAVPAAELSGLSGLDRTQKTVDVLAQMVEALLPAGPAAADLIDTVPIGDPRDVWFVVRCVYTRPNCGPLFSTLVSAPTQRFQMAPFFDPDAPARPVRIPMPLDISPAGLRKYQKNTGFVISDMLCGKIKRIRKMTLADLVLSVLPWPFHKDLPDVSNTGPCSEKGSNFGMICSLSIPIVTLCALILMMIIVALFDLFFRWIPFLFICLPIPGLKGKTK